MSTTETQPTAAPEAIDPPLSMRDLTTVLIKHYGLRDGHFDLLVEFQIGTGSVGPDPSNTLPGAMIGLSKVGLVRSVNPGPATVDAAEVNPQAVRKRTPRPRAAG